MLTKKSRYKNSPRFEPLAAGTEIFNGLRTRQIGLATGVIEHQVLADDRLDHLARHYYNDDRLWWRIVDANPLFSFAPEMLAEEMAGKVILIPKVKD